jgi:PAS domain S-box-containing protein
MLDSQDQPPFGLDAALPAFARATRLAKTLFGALDASIVLIGPHGPWRSRKSADLPTDDPAAEMIIATGQPMWIEDALRDPRFATDGSVIGPLGLRGYVGVPVRIADGRTIGVICVVDNKPLPYDKALAARLCDLAAMVADECDRGIVAQAAAQNLRELEHTKAILAAYVETTPVSVVMTDREMRVIMASPTWLKNFHVTQEEAQGRTLYEIVPDQYPRFRSSYERCLEGEFIRGDRVRWMHEGSPRWLQATVSPWRDAAGEVGGVLIASHDVTEIVQAKEEAEAANAAKSAFLATMSHEIRTPLNGVLGMAQAMEADEMSPAQRERLAVVRQSGEALLAILNDVLDLSKIEAGKLDLEETEFDIGQLARGAHAAFTAVAAKKRLAFDLKIDKAAKGVYRGDANRVRQILLNLVSNALKFTDAGRVRIAVERTGETLVLTVSDTGIGIAPDRLEHLFEKFEQADASTNRRFGGTGLGLSICRELAALMGGEISAHSEPGGGAMFTVTLPLTRVSATSRRAARPAPKPAPAPMADRPLKVLAAEDNSVNQLVLRTLLNQVGLQPVIVENGAHAVVAWEREPWDVILMDVQMPEVDGPTATKIIRERELTANRPRTPIVALTANAMSHQVEAYRAVGMDAFVAKPIEIAALFQAIQDVLTVTEQEAAA